MRSPVKPKKFLGQHFLKDMDIARRIAETMIGYAGVPILEIGPGTGVLTRFLLSAGHDLTVVEIDLIPCCSGMIQKEVAERMASGPGNKNYGILSVLMQAWYDIEYLFTVPEHVFEPPPKVKSAVIRMTRNKVTDLGCSEQLFKQIVKTSFNQRRKTLRNSLKPILGKECPLYESPIFDKRPEQLSVDQFISLTKEIEVVLPVQ